ncbi:MAG: LysR family transcriptional regulator [Parasporobacterium sp.]|nr:LysR family transcriptional regulator [Parasporobacterium sp.]
MISDELNNFMVVAECLNFTEAAEHLHIAQPAISRQISKMEKQLGVKLFERTTRKVRLTPAGESYQKLCRMFLIGCENLLAEYPRYALDEVSRGVVLGIGGLMETHYTTEILDRFATDNPQIPINIVQHEDDQLVRLMDEEQIDIAILPLPQLPESNAYEYCIFDKDSLKVAVWKGHPLEKKKSVQIADLKNEKFILNSKAPRNLLNRLYQICDRNYFYPKISGKASSIHLSLMMVSARQGIMLFSHHNLVNVPDNITFLDIEVDCQKDDVLEASLVFFWKKEKRLNSQAIQKMVDVIKEVVEEKNREESRS